MTYSGERNPNWGGGRSIASNGYVLIRVGVEHHLADVRGYAYEHRVVAEQTLGRRLKPGEVVHHIDHDKTNNSPGNLLVCTVQEHGVEHRDPSSDRRLPGEPNHLVACLCGCGERFTRFDDLGRPRDYISGHNSHQLTHEQMAIIARLGRGPMKRGELAVAVDHEPERVSVILGQLLARGLVTKTGRARWALASDAGSYQQDAGTEPNLLTVAWAATEWSSGHIRDADFLEAINVAIERIRGRQ